MTSIKVLSFGHESEKIRDGEEPVQGGDRSVSVSVQELLDPAYGCYVWPSALLMGEYLWHNKSIFYGKTVLEIGAGTAIPSLILAKLPGPHRPRLIITDIESILPNIYTCLSQNDVSENDTKLHVRELLWGEFGQYGVDGVLADVQEKWGDKKVDWILGSDTFYDPKDFEAIIVTISYIFKTHNSQAKFLTAYQERSAKRSIQYLLEKYSLICREIDRKTFINDKYYHNHENLPSGELDSVFLLEISLNTE